jgi:hypothetical protein
MGFWKIDPNNKSYDRDLHRKASFWNINHFSLIWKLSSLCTTALLLYVIANSEVVGLAPGAYSTESYKY